MVDEVDDTPLARPSSERPQWSTLLWGIAFLALVVTVGEWYRGVVALQQPPLRPDLAGANSGLRTLIWTDDTGVASSTTVRLWFLFDNQTQQELRNFRFLTFKTPGFRKIPGCWDDRQPVCAPGSQEGTFRKVGMPRVLKPDRTEVVYALVRPRLWFGRHGASGILAWKDSKGKDYQRAMILPGLEFHSEPLNWLSGFAKTIEICAIPLVLAILGLKLKQQEEHRETAAKINQEWQIRLQETWNLQLLKVTRDISKYYMPVYTAIPPLLQQSRTLNPASSFNELHLCLFRLFRLIRRMATLSRKIGGISFKNYDGENLAANCWQLFEDTANRRWMSEVEEDSARIGDIINSHTSLAQFMDLVKGSTETGLSVLQRRRVARSLARLTDGLRTWIASGEFPKDLVLLEIFLYILSFEMTRPLELWYGHLGSFPSESFDRAVSQLPPEHEKLKKRLELYQKDCKEAVERSLARWKAARATGSLLLLNPKDRESLQS